MWKKQVETDTDETDDDHVVGGLGFYSHGSKALTHQHWPEQIVSAGSFNANDTQASEASHKTNMGLASLRVRHGRDDTTQSSMHKYLGFHTLFKEVSLLHHRLTEVPTTRRRKTVKHGVGHVMSNAYMGDDLTSVDVQQYFLHPEVRIARVELLDLLCSKLGIRKTRESYYHLQCLTWAFGKTLVMPNGVTYWATDSNYLGQTGSRRRDVFLLKGTERVAGIANALSCESIVFIEINGLTQFCENTQLHLPPDLAEELDVNGTLTLVLGRWLTPHPTSQQRDSLCRPVCPAPLQHNHCLWMYAKTPRPRKIMVDSRGIPSRAFEICRDVFGSTRRLSDQRWEEEKSAYYTLLLPSVIITTVNMTREYRAGSETLEKSDVWLETVTIV